MEKMVLTFDFENEEEETGSIFGTMSHDTDNGKEGEGHLSGALVMLTDSSGSVVERL